MLHSMVGPNRTGSIRQERIQKKMTDLGVLHPTAIQKNVDPDGEHSLRMRHCPNGSTKPDSNRTGL